MYRRTYAEINLDHLAHNIRAIRQAFPEGTFLCPMVKANAYGHGDVQVARFLEGQGVRHLGVCLIEEGLLLRNLGIKTDILVFRGFDRAGARKIIEQGMTPVVSAWDHLEYLEAEAKGPVQIHLKFNLGMNRLGFAPEEAERLRQRLQGASHLRLEALVMHLSHGEDAVDAAKVSGEQLRRFHEVCGVFPGVPAHALNSAGILSKMKLLKEGANHDGHPLFLRDWGLRPGLMVYGYNPLSETEFIDLKPVMSLKSQAGVLRRLRAGEAVSYGGTWIAPRESVIAVVPIGYADGYHRILSNQGFALFAGHRVPVVGAVCMDYLMLDVTEVVGAKDPQSFKEAEVVLFGQSEVGTFLSPEELAKKAGTITWEMLTSVGERVPRVYKGGL